MSLELTNDEENSESYQSDSNSDTDSIKHNPDVFQIKNTLFVKSKTVNAEDVSHIDKHLVCNIIAPFLEVVESSAFECFYFLTTVFAPKLKDVQSAAFRNCYALRKVEANLEHIGSDAFYFCLNLQHVNLTNVKKFDNSCFNSCCCMIEFKNHAATQIDTKLEELTALQLIDIEAENCKKIIECDSV